MNLPEQEIAIMSFYRARVFAFLIGGALMWAYLCLIGRLRNSILSLVSENVLLAVAAFSIVMLLFPIVVLAIWCLTNPRMFCPHCQRNLTSTAAVRAFIRSGKCIYCENELSGKPTRREIVANVIFCCGGFLLLAIFMFNFR